MICWGRFGGSRIAMSPQPDSETLNNYYGEEWCFVKDQTRDSLLPIGGLLGSDTPAHVVIPPMLLALYSVLTMYCIHIALYGVYVLHDVLGKSWGSPAWPS